MTFSPVDSVLRAVVLCVCRPLTRFLWNGHVVDVSLILLTLHRVTG